MPSLAAVTHATHVTFLKFEPSQLALQPPPAAALFPEAQRLLRHRLPAPPRSAASIKAAETPVRYAVMVHLLPPLCRNAASWECRYRVLTWPFALPVFSRPLRAPTATWPPPPSSLRGTSSPACGCYSELGTRHSIAQHSIA